MYGSLQNGGYSGGYSDLFFIWEWDQITIWPHSQVCEWGGDAVFGLFCGFSNHLAEKDRVGSFALIVMWLSVSLPHDATGSSVVFDYDPLIYLMT